MIKLQPELLDSTHDQRSGPVFHAVTNAHGLYSTMDFVLRLSPKVHQTLGSLNSGIIASQNAGFDGVQAMSTYLHETIHWWQHIGSTYGLIFGLNFPVQSHCIHRDLQELTHRVGFKKPISVLAEALNRTAPGGHGTTTGLANTIINQHYDLEAYRHITYGGPTAQNVVTRNLFESVGHAFHMTYANTVNIIGSTIDKHYSTLQHPKEWAEGFNDLKVNKHENHTYGEPITLWPFGSREIFEGQARFSQIQYLSNANGQKLNWSDFRDLGWFGSVYTAAFETFLKLLEETWPADITDPLVGLFLLVCDFSINPGSGFPFTVDPNYETFLDDVTPAARFVAACVVIRKQFSNMKTAIGKHSRDEYENLSGDISHALKEPSPMLVSSTCAGWFAQDGPFSTLRAEHGRYNFDDPNYLVRYLLAHFFAFQEDKQKRPEYFCWPGSWMAGKNLDTDAASLFDKHGAPFVDREDNYGIFPRIQSGRTQAKLQNALDKFYQNTVVYRMTDQWVGELGPFKYDASWLTETGTKQEIEEFMRGVFKSAYGLDPINVDCL